jgi:hypothetical protein
MVIGTSLLLAGYGPAVAADDQQYSGFIEDYSGLEKATDPMGTPLLRVVNPRFTPANYHALIIEPVQLYPEPQPSKKVSQTTINDVVNHINAELKRQFAAVVQVVDSPGPGVARLRAAITDVRAETEGLKPYQFIPVALILTTASRAVAGAPEEAALFLESEVTDSVSGARLMVEVREGTGETLRETVAGEKVVTLDTLKPLINRWIEGGVQQAKKYIKPRQTP